MYAVLYDYGSDGLKYLKDEDGDVWEFYKVDFAFKKAVELNYSAPFEVVKRVRYEVTEIYE